MRMMGTGVAVLLGMSTLGKAVERIPAEADCALWLDFERLTDHGFQDAAGRTT